MKSLNLVSKVLILVGALNWGLVGALNIDLVAKLFGNMTGMSRLVYCLVGAAAIYKIVGCAMKKGCCNTSACDIDKPTNGGCCSH